MLRLESLVVTGSSGGSRPRACSRSCSRSSSGSSGAGFRWSWISRSASLTDRDLHRSCPVRHEAHDALETEHEVADRETIAHLRDQVANDTSVIVQVMEREVHVRREATGRAGVHLSNGRPALEGEELADALVGQLSHQINRSCATSIRAASRPWTDLPGACWAVEPRRELHPVAAHRSGSSGRSSPGASCLRLPGSRTAPTSSGRVSRTVLQERSSKGRPARWTRTATGGWTGTSRC